jgi:hypothetical protein
MATHKYEVGQNVRFRPNRKSTLVGRRQVKSWACCRLKKVVTFTGSSASPKTSSASQRRVNLRREASINEARAFRQPGK